MLALSEFFVGTIADAPIGSLILPRSKYDRPGIIGTRDDQPFFVILGQDHRFQGFPSAGNARYKGLIVPDVVIEVDETSIGEPDRWDTPLGSIMSQNGEIGVVAAAASSFGAGHFVVRLASVKPSEFGVSFSKWRVVLGNGSEKRTLLSFDAKADP